MAVFALMERQGIGIETTSFIPNVEALEGKVRVLIAPPLAGTHRGGMDRRTLRRKLNQAPTLIIFPKWITQGRDTFLIPQEFLQAYGRQVAPGNGR